MNLIYEIYFIPMINAPKQYLFQDTFLTRDWVFFFCPLLIILIFSFSISASINSTFFFSLEARNSLWTKGSNWHQMVSNDKGILMLNMCCNHFWVFSLLLLVRVLRKQTCLPSHWREIIQTWIIWLEIYCQGSKKILIHIIIGYTFQLYNLELFLPATQK